MVLNRKVGLLIGIAAVLAFIGVAMGAFAAHGLKSVLSDGELATIRTGVLYQFIHSLAILLCVLLSLQSSLSEQTQLFIVAAWCFVFGCLLFSGSLYGLVLLELPLLGPVTPVGGLLFLCGWFCLTFTGFKIARSNAVE